jgi:hypothetical protein
MRRLLRVLALLPVWLLLLLLVAWGAAALWFDGPAARPGAGALGGVFALVSLAILAFRRPLRRGIPLFLVVFAILYGWWSRNPARNDRDWQPDVAVSRQWPSGRVSLRTRGHRYGPTAPRAAGEEPDRHSGARGG